MRNKCIYLLLNLFLASQILSNPILSEIYINNRVQDAAIYTKFYPISAIYRASLQWGSGYESKYTLASKDFDPTILPSPTNGVSRRDYSGNYPLRYLVGYDGYALSNMGDYPGYVQIPYEAGSNFDNWILLGHDYSSNSDIHGLFGYGKYMFEIWKENNNSLDSVCSLIIDWSDFNYPYQSSVSAGADLTLRIESLSPLNITFFWDSNELDANTIPLFGPDSPPFDGSIKVYKQYHKKDDGGEWIGYNLNNEYPPSLGISTTDPNFLVYPLDGRDLPAPYDIEMHNNSGLLWGNLSINNNVSTLTALNDMPTDIAIKKRAALKIDANKTFALTTASSGYTNLVVQDTAYLILYHSSKIVIDSPNRITLQNKSNLTLGSNSEIVIGSGGLFCNEGGTVRGPGIIRYKSGTHVPPCRPDSKVISFGDSVKMILDSNAILEIPDSTTLKFNGIQSKLILTPTSKLKLGVNSKLVFEGKARMIARYSTIISKDTTKLWDGIYSSDLSFDTISNCKIINAKNGINLVDKYEEEWSDHSVIITDCDFINKTSSYINNAVYGYNSDRILFRNNEIYGESTGGFYCGVNFEFCISPELLVMDNEFEDCYIGISDIQSSAYIARNVIEGSSGYGYGITLDNSWGIVKCNVINGFDASIVAYISSPYIYKNTLSGAATINLSLEGYSVPMMNPAVVETYTYWIGGNNTFSLSENGIGIGMYSGGYPYILNGYNKFYLGDGDYYIDGEIPEELNDSLEAKNNHWSPSVGAGNFNTTNGNVKYNPTEDGTEGRSYNLVHTVDIGFGFYDTIYVNNEGENLITDVFIAAHTAEHSRNFEDAIEYYKDLVTTNEGNFSRLSIQRIYGCYEKAGFFGEGVTEAKNYFDDLRSNTNYDEISRALANDMYLKAKFRNAELTSVESAYEQMYQNNQNNGIGVHALINKTIVEDLISDSTDNLSATMQFQNLEEHKESIFQILKRNSNVPFTATNTQTASQFRLGQNYPNPFNPSTIIRYSISDPAFITLKIFDMLGREVITLVDNELKTQGNYEINFDGSNLSNGVYFYKLQAGNVIQTKRMLLIK